MSQVQSAKQICEQALRNIGAFPVTDSAADGNQLRQAMTSLDMIMAEEAGANKLFFLVPEVNTVPFPITNGTGTYDLIDTLGGNAPADGIQFPLAAHLIIQGAGQTIVGFANITGVQLGQVVTDTTNAGAVPAGTTVIGINSQTNQVTLSAACTIAIGDTVQFAASPSPINLTVTSLGTNPVQRREPIEIVTRDRFLSSHNPNEQGRPRMVYIDRLPDMTLSIFPVPASSDPTSYTIILDVQTYAPNVAPAGVTGTQPQDSVLTGFRQAWQRFLTFQLSHDLGSGAIFKLPEASLNRFGKIADASRTRLEAFENREHDDEPPICDGYQDEMNDSFENHRQHHRDWGTYE